MRRINYQPYLFLFLLLTLVLSLPKKTTQKLRFMVMSSFTPPLEWMQKDSSLATDLIAQKVVIENKVLEEQLQSVKEWLTFEERIEEQVQRLKQIQHVKEDDLFWRDFFRRRSEDLRNILDLQMQAVPAKVIFRDPSSWSSFIWINVGEKENEALGRAVVAKNSPVVIGDAIVGVIEEVGYQQSQVRLITDSRLVPSVRATRGGQQDRYLLEHLDVVLRQLELRDDLFASKEKEGAFFEMITSLKQRLESQVRDRFLAKGELFGSSDSLWRCRGNVLKGVGFNYDFSDEEGEARDLRTGELLRQGTYVDPIPLLKLGDLLVTTGYDGIFPSGFRVAIVSKIEKLREGASSYEIEAEALAGNFLEIKQVFVLPPVSLVPVEN